MRKRIIATSLMAISLLTSCGNSRTLRSDIAEFIASFSLKDAIDTYTYAGYHRVECVSDGEKTTKTDITFDFDVRDPNDPQYRYQEKKYLNDELTETTIYYIEKLQDKFYLVKNEEKEEKTLKEIGEIITKYFYTSSLFDDTYHTGGMYYGDLIKEMAISLQDLVEIDLDNQLYIYNYKYNTKENGEDVSAEGGYIVNSLGMLISASSKVNTANRESSISVNAYRYE